MRTCKNCLFENKDTALYCVKCGESLDKRCPVCKTLADEDAKFCAVCGARVDGKINCPACKAENEKTNAFCEKCGSALNGAACNASIQSQDNLRAANAPIGFSPSYTHANPASPFTPAAPSSYAPAYVPVKTRVPHPHNRAYTVRILDIIRTSVTLAFALIIFIASFFTVRTIDDQGYLKKAGLMNKTVSIRITTLDCIEGAFAFANPKPDEVLQSDFEEYIKANLSAEELSALISGEDNDESIRVAIKLIEGYNFFKLLAQEEMMDSIPSLVTTVWVSAIFSIAYIGLTATFLVFAVIDFIKTLIGKTKKSKCLSLFNVFVFACAAALNFLMRMGFQGSVGVGPMLGMILGILSLGLDLTQRIISGDLKLVKAKLPAYISAAVGCVVAVLVFVLAGNALVSIVCEGFSESATSLGRYRGKYNSTDLFGSWDAWKVYRNDKDMLGKGSFFITSLFSQYGSSSSGSLILASMLSPALTGILGDLKIEVALMIFGIFIEICSVGLIASAALCVADHLSGFIKDRQSKLVYTILTLSFSAALLLFVLVYILLVNKTMETVKNVKYTASISVGLVITVLACAADLIQRIICRTAVRKALCNSMPVVYPQ